MKKFLLTAAVFLSLFFGSVAPILAADVSPTCTTNGINGINTAIGCVPYSDTNAFVGFVLGWAIGIGGGIAFLLILYGGFMIMTSQEDRRSPLDLPFCALYTGVFDAKEMNE